MKEPSHDPLLTSIPALLGKLDRPGDFFGSGAVELPVCRIAVEGVGDLGLPVPLVQAEALRAAAEDAPYGRGPRTIVDKAIRRCGQLDASAVRADDPRWRAALDAVVAAAAAALGVTGAVTAGSYKLLVYGPGDFFVEHRDTEKSPGMFATLVVALPSAHAGGKLVVRHEGREACVTLAGDDLGVARWAAFYCDCAHELEPLTAGFRVALVYNLVRRAKGTPRAPDSSAAVTALAEALGAWAERPGGPSKLVIPLAHRYTLAELDFGALKGRDAASAQALTRAAARADCVVRLATLSITESGAAEPAWDGYSRSRRSRDREEEGGGGYEVVEVNERKCALREWRAPDGGGEDYGAIEVVEEEEVAPPDALEGAEPDEDQLHEAMGNGGASFERTYRWTALVVWPDAREHEVLEQGGLAAMLGAIERHAAADRERALRLARHLTANWSTLQVAGRGAAAQQARALRLFVALGVPALVIDLLAALAATDGLDGRWTSSARLVAAATEDDLDDDDLDDGDDFEDDEDDDDDVPPTPATKATAPGAIAPEDAEVAATVDALASLPADDARRAASTYVRGRGAVAFDALARVLLGAARARGDESMRAPIAELAAALSGMASPATWRSPSHEARAQGLADLLRAAVVAGGAQLAQCAALAAVEARAAAPPDAVLVPCALALQSEAHPPVLEAVAPLLDACRRHLEARCALPLEAPADAAREVDGLTCKCAHCASLITFLRDPVARRWQLKAAQVTRAHVEDEVSRARVDVEMSTVRSGSPHCLVCTKTAARYEARVRQRAADTAALAALAAWPSA